MTTVEINGNTYRIAKLHALAQFHVTRRLGPAIASVWLAMSAKSAEGGTPTPADFATLLGPILQLLSSMSDEDANYIIYTCLTVVARQQDGGKFAAVATGSQLMFDDIDMSVLIKLVFETLKENLGNFWKELGDGNELPSS